ncbi:hypothetical protein ACJRO7_030051 [Eucalyptus globulus]|uniref:Uncharacterized protein n=1 Tax=Eucalyptus globulus TaxID=34317 RepID=A0ABD3JCY4_EUCGL
MDDDELIVRLQWTGPDLACLVDQAAPAKKALRRSSSKLIVNAKAGSLAFCNLH